MKRVERPEIALMRREDRVLGLWVRAVGALALVLRDGVRLVDERVPAVGLDLSMV